MKKNILLLILFLQIYLPCFADNFDWIRINEREEYYLIANKTPQEEKELSPDIKKVVIKSIDDKQTYYNWKYIDCSKALIRSNGSMTFENKFHTLLYYDNNEDKWSDFIIGTDRDVYRDICIPKEYNALHQIIPDIAKAYRELENSSDWEYSDNFVYADFIREYDKMKPINERTFWYEYEKLYVSWAQFRESKYIYKTSMYLMKKNNTINSLRRIKDIKKFQQNSPDNPFLNRSKYYETYGAYLPSVVRLQEANHIIAKYLKYTHNRLITFGWKQQRDWYGEYRSFGQNVVSLLGSYIGAMLDVINILTFIFLLVLYRRFLNISIRKKIIISFMIGIITNALVEPLPIIASHMDYMIYSRNDILISVFSGGLFGLIIFCIFVLFGILIYSITTPKEIKIENRNKKELLNIKDLIEHFKTLNDYEIADFLFRLMIYRDSNYQFNFLEAFINPPKNIYIVTYKILPKLRRSIILMNIFSPNKTIIPIIWLQTLKAINSNNNIELVNELWTQLQRGFELSKAKYLSTTSKKYNFDNTDFYMIPLGIEINK